jgi:hypothetical protein
MKNLLYKEFKLAAHPTTYIFLSFGLMMLIPNYPGYVQFFYAVMSLFFVFLTGRENKDIFYTLSLPIRKSDVVKARCLMVGITEIAQITVSIPFALISVKIYEGLGTSNLAGIEANVAFYGFVFLMLSVFNGIFIPLFYKTGYKVGIPFLLAIGGLILFYVGMECLVWIPSPVSAFLDTSDPAIMIKQVPILLAGLLIWGSTLVFTFKKAAANFEKVDV